METVHTAVTRELLAAGWTHAGAGDWAVALRSPDGCRAARISPFDPVGPYTAALYREAAHTRQVPRLFEHRRLDGGGDLQILEWLDPVPEPEAAAFLRSIAAGEPEVAELAGIVRRVHERARRELPWCGPLDTNPANVMRGDDGRLVMIDPYYADGPALYATAAREPEVVAARIPENERRYMTEIPLASSGPWKPAEREAMRAGLAAADRRPFDDQLITDPAEPGVEAADRRPFYDQLITGPAGPWVEAADRRPFYDQLITGPAGPWVEAADRRPFYDQLITDPAEPWVEAADRRPFYARHAGFYDQLITDPAGPWVEAVDRELGGPAAVLDAGCGTGRHAAGLIARGHRVDLVDASADLLAIAAARCPGSRATRADLRHLKTEPVYDAVTCRGVLNDLITDDERRAALRSLTGSLRAGGFLLLDVREREGSRRRADGSAKVRRAGPLTFTSRTTWDSGLLRVAETYDLDGQTTHHEFTMRPWTEEELRAGLSGCGLDAVRVEPGIGRRTPDRLYVVAGPRS
ncbi:class I SAM-dependent methyltransferase [Actinoplanes sp. LDG1-06]|uniref:Class I SAM-dependent methyltransferase n=1 Tax=Paractinoplanes ovalisporus TaxID=2810368 RepID=A0ABS2AK50_9ACTN|nr:class I SAM-dependent methyltransferase [Actinoplanes ovalisporus]MBM2620220.1 class I SAM-dependent methyltransferase [Actinoplanes ovalisporus]